MQTAIYTSITQNMGLLANEWVIVVYYKLQNTKDLNMVHELKD